MLLRLPFPLLFSICSEKTAKGTEKAAERAARALATEGMRVRRRTAVSTAQLAPVHYQQYTHAMGVLEFSAAEGTVAVPSWLISDAGLRHDETALLTTLCGVRTGAYARLRPGEACTWAAATAAAGGAREGLEVALRTHAALAVGARPTLDIGGIHVPMTVNAVRAAGDAAPAAAVISLHGDVDLEVDIDIEGIDTLAAGSASALAADDRGAPCALATGDCARLNSGKETEQAMALAAPTDPIAAQTGKIAVARSVTTSLHSIDCKHEGANSRCAVASFFSGVGERAVVSDSAIDSETCALCGVVVPVANSRLHAFRCTKQLSPK